jgi:hypothetical protein
MLHQKIKLAGIEQADLDQAFSDAGADHAEHRAHRLRLAKTKPGTMPYSAELEYGAEIRSRIAAIGQRLGLRGDQLLELMDMRRFAAGEGIIPPTMIHQKMEEFRAAQEAENEALRALNDARSRHAAARLARVEAEKAYRAVSVQPLVVD